MSKYSEAEIEEAQLALIDAIPVDGIPCEPYQLLPHLSCDGHREALRLPEVAERVALWQGTAEALLDGFINRPSVTTDELGNEVYPTEPQRDIAQCIVMRAIGRCPRMEKAYV